MKIGYCGGLNRVKMPDWNIEKTIAADFKNKRRNIWISNLVMWTFTMMSSYLIKGYFILGNKTGSVSSQNQFVIFNPWKVPWNWIAFYQNSFVTSPGLFYHLILDDLQTRPLHQILLFLRFKNYKLRTVCKDTNGMVRLCKKRTI